MRIRTALLATFVAAACTAGSGGDADSGDTGATAAETGTGTPTGGAAGALGTACTHNGQLGFDGAQLAPLDPACGEALCVYADDSRAPTVPCTTDFECNAGDPTRMRFVCTDGECELWDAYVLERSMCAASCTADSDCVGADPATTCQSGFSCLIFTASCCTPMCVCNDDVSAGGVDAATADCAMQPEPGCEF